MVYARVIVEVAPAHLDHTFDYRVPDGVDVRRGQRVRVTFAGRRRTGWVVATASEPATDVERIRDLHAVQGTHTWFGEQDLRLYRWVAQRYAASLADVLRHALPARVAAVERDAAAWEPPAQAAEAAGRDHSPPDWEPYGSGALLAAVEGSEPPAHGKAFWWRPLPGEDVTRNVVDLVGRCLRASRSVLVLAPDPASSLLDETLRLAGPLGADLRLRSDRARYRAFLRCRTGHARVAVGERGAALAPLPALGLVVVADEANPAYKERRSPRHHAREVALARARMAGATALLIGDLPSDRLVRLLADGHVAIVEADRGTERSRAPLVEVVDRSSGDPSVRRGRLAPLAARRISEAVRSGGVAVVLASRGGEGAALACRQCGTRRACPVCDGSVRPVAAQVAEPGRERWECPACGWSGLAFACPACRQSATAPLVAGAGRLAAELARSHPQAEVVRMEGFDAPGPQGRPAVAVMTRGSAVARPGWLDERGADVVVLPDVDALLGLPAFDAGEDALRLWFAVGRWTRRLVVQTRQPGHAAVQALVRWDARGYWRQEWGRRAELRYPPAASLVALRAPVDAAPAVAAELRAALPPGDELLGPDPGGAMLVKSASLHGTLDALTPLRHAWSKAGRGVRVDVDPVEVG